MNMAFKGLKRIMTPTMPVVVSRLDADGNTQVQIRHVAIPARKTQTFTEARLHDATCVGGHFDDEGNWMKCEHPVTPHHNPNHWLCQFHHEQIHPVKHFNDERQRIAAIIKDDKKEIAASGLKPLGRYGTGW